MVKKEYFDLLIVVPMEIELAELCKVFAIKEDRTGQGQFVGALDVAPIPLTALVVLLPEVGVLSANNTTRQVLSEYDVGLIVSYGVAGRISDDLKLFDVCYTGTVLDITQNQRITDTKQSGKGLNIDLTTKQHQTPQHLTNVLNHMRVRPVLVEQYQKWRSQQEQAACDRLAEIGMKPQRISEIVAKPDSHGGMIACGPLIKGSNMKDRLTQADRKILAIEMESTGVFSAALEGSPPQPCLVIRGISDAADKNKGKLEDETRKLCQSIAAHNAATFLKLQLESTQVVKFIQNLRIGENSQQAHLPEPDLLTRNSNKLTAHIDRQLRELSPEYRLRPQGYKLPLPRIHSVSVLAAAAEKATTAIEVLDALKFQSAIQITIPNTYPDSCLAYIVADSMLNGILNEKLVIPIVVDGDMIRPPKHSVASLCSEFDIEELGGDPSAQIVFIVDNPPVSSKTRSDFLSREMGQVSNAKWIFVRRGEFVTPEEENYLTKNSIGRYEVGDVSFLEIVNFVETNYPISGNESQAIAIQLIETLKQFKLTVHPGFFAAIPEELLGAVIRSSWRVELVQLSINGYLSRVSENAESPKLRRDTMQRLLMDFSYELNVEKRTQNKSQTVEFFDAFLKRHDFPTSSIALLESFIANGILRNAESRVQFCLPFVERFLLAQKLKSQLSDAIAYFNPRPTDFDYLSFDFYAELGAADEIVNNIIRGLQQSYDLLSSHKVENNILLTNAFSTKSAAHPILALKARLELNKSLEKLSSNSEEAKNKQKIIDFVDRAVQSEPHQDAFFSDSEVDLEAVQISLGQLQIGSVLLGFGAETLTASTKDNLQQLLLSNASMLVPLWTRAVDDSVADQLRSRLKDADFMKGLGEKLSTQVGAEKIFEALVGFFELIVLTLPIHIVLDILCSHARSPILAPTITKCRPNNLFEKILRSVWLLEVDGKSGLTALRQLKKELRGAPTLRLALATFVQTRAHWYQSDASHRKRMLEAAEELLSISQPTT